MKLRNKKTGEIHEITEVVFLHDMDKKFVIYSKTEGHNYAYKNLAELNAGWEDYEEPKDYYFIRSESLTVGYSPISNSRSCRNRKEIGNYFETKEEAEKAVEKLKAWKRLKDKGFKFLDHIDRDCGQGLTRYEWSGYIDGEDLDLLFGDD